MVELLSLLRELQRSLNTCPLSGKGKYKRNRPYKPGKGEKNAKTLKELFAQQTINQSCVGCSRYLQHPKETHRPSSMSRPVPHPFPLLGGYRGYGCYPQTGLFKGSNFFNAAGHLWEGATGVLQLAGGVHSPTSLARPDRTS